MIATPHQTHHQKPTKYTSTVENHSRQISDAAERRRRSLILAGRARRREESSLIQELGQILPRPAPPPLGPDVHGHDQDHGRPLDKASVLRLALCYMRMKRILNKIHVTAPSSLFDFGECDVQQLLLGGAHVIVVTSTGIITCVSSSMEAMGKSIYDWTHPTDHDVIQHLIGAATTTADETTSMHTPKPPTPSLVRSDLVRFKHRMFTSQALSGLYKVFQVRGKLYPGEKCCNSFFIGLVEPILSPADNSIPMLAWYQRHIVTSFFSPDFKYATFSFLHRVPGNIQSAISQFTGFSFHEVHGVSCFDMIHPDDAPRLATQAKILAAEGQIVGEFRWLRKSGGYLHVYSQLTLADSRGKMTTKRDSAVIVCRHFLLNVYEEAEIVSDVQLRFIRGQVQDRCESGDSVDDVCLAASPREASPIYPENESSMDLSPLGGLDLEMEKYDEDHKMCGGAEGAAADLVPSDELDTLEEYLQVYSQDWSPDSDSYDSNGNQHADFTTIIC